NVIGHEQSLHSLKVETKHSAEFTKRELRWVSHAVDEFADVFITQTGPFGYSLDGQVELVHTLHQRSGEAALRGRIYRKGHLSSSFLAFTRLNPWYRSQLLISNMLSYSRNTKCLCILLHYVIRDCIHRRQFAKRFRLIWHRRDHPTRYRSQSGD